MGICESCLVRNFSYGFVGSVVVVVIVGGMVWYSCGAWNRSSKPERFVDSGQTGFINLEMNLTALSKIL